MTLIKITFDPIPPSGILNVFRISIIRLPEQIYLTGLGPEMNRQIMKSFANDSQVEHDGLYNQLPLYFNLFCVKPTGSGMTEHLFRLFICIG